MWFGPDGYLRPDQFLDHLTVIKTEGMWGHGKVNFIKVCRFLPVFLFLGQQCCHNIVSYAVTHLLPKNNVLPNSQASIVM